MRCVAAAPGRLDDRVPGERSGTGLIGEHAGRRCRCAVARRLRHRAAHRSSRSRRFAGGSASGQLTGGLRGVPVRPPRPGGPVTVHLRSRGTQRVDRAETPRICLTRAEPTGLIVQGTEATRVRLRRTEPTRVDGAQADPSPTPAYRTGPHRRRRSVPSPARGGGRRRCPRRSGRLPRHAARGSRCPGTAIRPRRATPTRRNRDPARRGTSATPDLPENSVVRPRQAPYATGRARAISARSAAGRATGRGRRP